MRGRFLFLGTGASTGVPVIGCDCDVCTSSHLFNKRLRSSGLITLGDKKLLIDVGPDFRSQAINFDIDRIDGLLITHVHFDHIAGIDDLRIFYFRQNADIPCLVSLETLDQLKKRFDYIFLPIGSIPTACVQFDFKLMEEDFGTVDFLGTKVDYMSYFQGNMKVSGFRFGDFAYLTDIRDFTDEVFVMLKGVKTLVISVTRHETSQVHLGIEDGIEFVRRSGAEKAYFTHIAHELGHEETNKVLPEHIKLAHDGLELEFDIE